MIAEGYAVALITLSTMVPIEALELFGPWAGILLGVASILWLVRFLVKDIYPGLKDLTVITTNVSGLPAMKIEVKNITSTVEEISSSVNDITETVKVIPDIQNRLSILEKEFESLKLELGIVSGSATTTTTTTTRV